jgi:2,4-dienoyl-CoA reductase-like NADH-dependent reductase (Old Yellow Enzyme family)
MAIRKIAALKTPAQFLDHLAQLGISLPFDETIQPAPQSPLAQPAEVDGFHIPNRWCVLPMEGWDGTTDGRPSDLTRRRWQRFGLSGAGLVWGGEAVAVRHDGRANPNQLVIRPDTLEDLADLRLVLLESYRQAAPDQPDPVIGLQLTHSGRFCRPNGKSFEPFLAYDHSLLNPRFGLAIPSGKIISDEMIEILIQDFVQAARLAGEAGFDFVDIKHCHGYLLHEFLSAVTRPGKYGGSLENRARPAHEIIQTIRSQVPGLKIGVRLSLFDFTAFRPGADRTGEAVQNGLGTPFCFGGDGSGVGIDLSEPIAFIEMLRSWGVRLINLTAGSPYYNPHIQRPAYYPPSDGYLPPEDPLVGAARQINAAAQVKARFPDLYISGTGYSCLQEYLPNVAQAAVRSGMIDAVGIGRGMLSYPELPLDVLAGRSLTTKRLCRTFSDCTTAPRNGLVSGCYPIDEVYKHLPEAEKLGEIKRALIKRE